MIYLIAPYSHIETDLYQPCTVEFCLEYFKNHQHIAVDTETKGRDCHSKPIICLQIGDQHNQFVIDVRHTPILRFKELLESKICIFHNAKFDYKFLKKAGIVVENIYDTMLAECVIFAGYENWGYGLQAVCQRYLKVQLDKSTRGDFYRLNSEPFNEYQIQYAAKDVEYLYQIMEIQQRAIEKYDLTYCVNLENEVVKALADIEYNGMKLNREKWLANVQRNTEQLNRIIHELDNIVLTTPRLSRFKGAVQLDIFGGSSRGVNINWSSPSQVERILRTLELDIEGTSDRELEKVVDKHPIIPLIQEYRAANKLLTTYGEGFLDYINPVTGKIHTNFWQIVSTGRVSSGSKDDNAPNLQNIPGSNTFRNCFEASEGFLWVSCDYSGQELRLMADASNEKAFIDVMNSGEDPHCFAGSLMFKREITKKDKDLRQKAKTVNFGRSPIFAL